MKGGWVAPWVTRQGKVEASTHMSSDAFLLAQHMYGQMASADSLRTATRVHLSVIPPEDKVLCDVGTFSFIASHLLSTYRRNVAVVVELLRLIERLEELHTKLYVLINSPRLALKNIYNVSSRCNLYLNMCMSESSSEDSGAPGSTVTFFLEFILLELEGGRYVGPILPDALADLVIKRG